ncbi:MAG: metallophosphoesterase [Candidatus Eisenbacteria bacterium]
MSAFRFVHLSDVHLDAPFASKNEGVRKLLAGSLRRSFERVVGLAIEERVHALLIAGDLFQKPDPSIAAETFLLGQIRRLRGAGIPVFYASGNHDPVGWAKGTRRIEWPEGTTVFADGDPARHEVRTPDGDLVAWVTGAGHEGPAVEKNLAARFPAASGPLPEIALLHASVEGAGSLEAHDRYAPCAPRDLRGKGYDYWALGHVHKRGSPLADPPAHYPGSLLGLDRTETGEKGVLLVEVCRGAGARVEFRPTAPVLWEEAAVDAAGAATLEALRTLLHTRIVSAGHGEGVLLTIELEGVSPLKRDLEHGEGAADLAGDLAEETGLAFLAVRTGRLRRAVDRDGARVGPLGAALDLIAALREGKEPYDAVLPELARPLPVDAAERDRYLRSLLEGAEEDLVDRMRRGTP